MGNFGDFYSVNEDEHTNLIADAVVQREQELHLYDVNIKNFELMLATLPKWNETMPAGASAEERDDFSFAVELRDRLATEKLQRARVFRVLSVLLGQLPVEKVAIIEAAKSRLLAAAGK